VAALPQRGPIPAIAFSRLAPSELVTLHATFQESAHLLEQADARRSEAEAELRDALARERLLTNDLDRQVHEKTRMLAKANAHLSQLVLELQDRDRQKAVFLAAISHELRTPLAILKGSLQTLQNPQLRLGPAEHDRLHQAMAEEIQHLAALVEDLLDTAQMDARSFALRLEADVDVASLVQGIVAGFGPQLETRGLSLELILREPLPAIQADPQRLGQVVRNLLDNVLKYAPAGSPVRLTVEAVPGGIEFVLEDGGPGVPESLRERIFEPFVRDPDPGRRGVGLGLAIARELVVAHGGTIELGASELGGSRFWFRLPTGGGPNRTASSPSR
jgi:signal transduction histidine kinase